MTELPTFDSVRANYERRAKAYDEATAELVDTLRRLGDDAARDIVQRFLSAHEAHRVALADFMQGLSMRNGLRIDRVERRLTAVEDHLSPPSVAAAEEVTDQFGEPDDPTGGNTVRRR